MCPRCALGSVGRHEEPALERDADRFAQRAGPALAGTLEPAAGDRPAALPAAAAEALQGELSIDTRDVRLHTEASSAAASHSLRARAFTVGNDIFFDREQYQPDSAQGRRLLAHELAHVAQQRQHGLRVQRSPYGDAAPGDDLHDPLTQDYTRQFPDAPQFGGVRYMPGYRHWLGANAASGVQFLPTTFTQVDPLQLHPVSARGDTAYSINGQPTAGGTIGAVISTIQTQLTPSAVVHSAGLVSGQVQCRFDPAQRIESGTHVTEMTPPPRRGWQANLAPVDVGAGGLCGTKTSVPVTLTDASGDPALLAKHVHDSELEHVTELHALHDRYFVPYYRFVLGLMSTSGSEAGCEARLRATVAQRDEQAATAFALGDLAATRRYDDSSSTHHAILMPTVSRGCASVTLTARQTHPPLPGAGPGNVVPIAPQSTIIDPLALSVNGSTLMSGANVVRVFASAADAATAMALMASLGVTLIQRIGPVEILLAGAGAASGSLQGIPTLDLHPDQYQVTLGIPNLVDWVLSEVVGAQPVEFANFGNARDAAYSALALMQNLAIRHQSRIGPAPGAGMTFYTG